MDTNELHRLFDDDVEAARQPHTTMNQNGDIVVGVDGSQESFAALRWALAEASVSGQAVNAVFGWTSSWDMGAEPENDEGWQTMREQITAKLRAWVDDACASLPRAPENITLTSVKASGTLALLEIGANAQQIVVGRRSLGRVTRWFSGSTSKTLSEESTVPVTVVRARQADEGDVRLHIADALSDNASQPDSEASQQQPVSPQTVPHTSITGSAATDSADTGSAADAQTPYERSSSTIVVGVDTTPDSTRALQFAAREASLHQVPLHVVFCWQVKELGTVPGYEGAFAPMDVNQRQAEHLVKEFVDASGVAQDVDVRIHAFHIPAARGLINASRYAGHLIIGSRGLTGLDAHFLGSVSNQVVDLAECTVSVVH